MFGVSKGRLVDRFEGVPEQRVLSAFMKKMLDEANLSVGPVSHAQKEYDALLQVSYVP